MVFVLGVLGAVVVGEGMIEPSVLGSDASTSGREYRRVLLELRLVCRISVKTALPSDTQSRESVNVELVLLELTPVGSVRMGWLRMVVSSDVEMMVGIRNSIVAVLAFESALFQVNDNCRTGPAR